MCNSVVSCTVSSFWQCPVVSEVAAGSFKEKSPPEICAKGYVVRTLEAALWAFYHTDNFKDGCLKVGEYTSQIQWCVHCSYTT